MAELTNNICKMVKSLDNRKNRVNEGAFKAEGTKCVTDTLPHFELLHLFATSEWLGTHGSSIERIDGNLIFKCPKREMSRVSSLSTPPEVVAVYKIPEYDLHPDCAKSNIVLALDTIQDPGNLGTIIRVADWFGIRDIICSKISADCYSPKVIQATMGSISRVKVHYCDLPNTIEELRPLNVYGTFLDGDNISDVSPASNGIIIIGNEGNGISDSVAKTVTKRLFIPPYPIGSPTGESLNAAVATAITLAKFRGI